MLLAKYMVETQQGSGPMPKISSPQLRLRQQIEGSQRQSLRGSQELSPQAQVAAVDNEITVNDCLDPSMIEAVTSAAKTTIAGFASGTIEVGEATPIVAPVFVALKLVRDIFDKVKRNKKQLEELHDRCTLITTYVIIRCNTESSSISVTPLMDCVDELKVLAKNYSVRGTFSRLANCRRDGTRIQRLRDRIEALVPILALAAVVRVSEQVGGVQSDVQRLYGEVGTALHQQTALVKEKLNEQTTLLNRVLKSQASMMKMIGRATLSLREYVQSPMGAPRAESWHITRSAVIDKVWKHLSAEDGPWLVGLVGRSGSGKSTAAAMIAEGGIGWTRPPEGAKHQEKAWEGLELVRTLFPDGVVWLNVGRGATERLPALMEDLANMVYEDVVNSSGYGPGESPSDPKNGAAYVRSRVTSDLKGRRLRCLLVADDVWESEVVDELRKTGMRVLLTSRNSALVQEAGGSVVGVERLSKDEAERLLRGAADLPPRIRLPDAAYAVIERCDRVAMYLESVGRWSTVRGRTDSKSWSKAVTAIDNQLRRVRRESAGREINDSIGYTCVAILRAGFDCLGAEDSISRWLYLALAVMPDSHAFEIYEAAVLLHGHDHSEQDLEQAGEVVAALERWAIVSVAGTGLYRLHDMRAEFARDLLCNRGDVRAIAVRHWYAHLSSLEVVQSVDVFALVGLWRALERVAGDDCVTMRPYDAALAKLDITDPSYLSAAQAVALLYHAEGDDQGAERVMQKVWERHENTPGANPRVGVSALWYCAQGAKQRGQAGDERKLLRRMNSLVQAITKEWKPEVGLEDATAGDEAIFSHHVALCCQSLRRFNAAELWFKRARKAQDVAKFGADHPHVAFTLHGLAQCERRAGRLRDAEDKFRQALKIKEARLGASALQVANTLRDLGNCVGEDMTRSDEAKTLLARALTIYEAKLGAADATTVATKREFERSGRSGVGLRVLRTTKDAVGVVMARCFAGKPSNRVWMWVVPAALLGGVVLAKRRM